MKMLRTLRMAAVTATGALLAVGTLHAEPTVIRDSGDTNNFVAIEGLTVDGAYYNVEAVWKSAELVYGFASGEYTFTNEATALLAVEAMNSALNAEGDISGVGYNGSGLGGAEAGTTFLIGYDDYDPGLGGKQVRAQSGITTNVVWRAEILEKDYDKDAWYAEFTAIDPPANLPVLTGLTISEGTLDPAFDGETRSYTASVSYETQSMTVTPSAETGTVITVNGDPVTSGQASLPQVLDVGENQILIALYGLNESSYSVVVTRPAGPPPPVLTALTISSGVLTPTFDGNTFDYTVTVPFETTTMTVTPTSDAAIAVNGTSVASGEASPEQILVLGENTIPIVLTAESQTSYSIVVTRMEERPTGLIVVRDDIQTDTAIGIINLVVSNILYDVDFVFGIVPDLYGDPAVYSFTTYGEASAAVDAINSALTEEGGILNVDTNDNKAIYRIGYVDVALSVSVVNGETTAGGDEWKLVSETISRGETTTYAIFTAVGTAPPPVLTDLTISAGTLTPEFYGDTRSYTATVSNDTLSVTVTPTAPAGTTIIVNGANVVSGEASLLQNLSVGENDILIELHAEYESSYMIVVTREVGAPPPVLTDLTISAGTLFTAFNSETRSYTATVLYDVPSVTVTPTADAGIAISVNGANVASGDASLAQPLNVGENEIEVLLNAESESSYTVVVTRKADGPTELAVIRDTEDANNAIGIEYLLVEGILYDVEFTLGGADDFYGAAPGEYTFTNEAAATLAVDEVNSALNAEGDISGVRNGGTLGSSFNIPFEYYEPVLGVGTLKARVGNVSSNDWNQSSSTEGDLLYLDESTSYAVFTRLGVPPETPAIPILTDLEISDGTLSPVFDSNTRSYTATVTFANLTVAVLPTAEAGTAISVNGESVTSGEPSSSQRLEVGENDILIVLNAESESSYTIVVTREEAPPPAELMDLTLDEALLTPFFNPNIRSYTAVVPYTTASVTLTATAAVPGSTTIIVDGAIVPSGQPSIPLNVYVGENELVTLVFADGAGGSYVIVVTRNSEQPATPVMTIEAGTNEVTISWAPDTPGWILQEVPSLLTNWVNSVSGSNNPVTIPLTEDTKYYRAVGP